MRRTTQSLPGVSTHTAHRTTVSQHRTLDPAKRLRLISYAVTAKWKSCFASTIGAATIVHALERLSLEPSRLEERRWNYLSKGIRLALPLMDLRTLCNVLHSSSRIVVRAFDTSSSLAADHRQHQQQQPSPAVIPSELRHALLAAQAEIILKSTTNDSVFSSTQTLIVFESLSQLRSLHVHQPLVDEELWGLVKERSPVLADHVDNTKDLASLLRVVSSDVEELSNASVVSDVLRNAKRILETSATHQDTMTLLDAIMHRRVDRHGNVLMRPVPQPLRPVLGDVFSMVSKHINELSPSQLAAWFSRVLDEFATRQDPSSKLMWLHANTNSNSTQAALTEVYDRELARLLLMRVRRVANLEGLTDSSLRTLSLAVSRVWTPPKSESQEPSEIFAVNSDHVLRVMKVFNLSLSDGVAAQLSILQEMHSRLFPSASRRRQTVEARFASTFLDALVAVPSLMYSADLSVQVNAVPDHHGVANMLLKVAEEHLKRHSVGDSRALGISSERSRAAFVAFGLRLALRHDGTSSRFIWQQLSSWCSSKRHLQELPFADLIFLMNDLCAYTYAPRYNDKGRINRGSQSVGQLHARGSLLRETLLGVHDVVKQRLMKQPQHVARSSTESPPSAHNHSETVNGTHPLAAVSVGQILRYASSMSKIGVRRKADFMAFLKELSQRSFTHFEMLRLVNVASRQGLYVPFLIDMIAANLAALQRSLKPKQKILLLKSLGQLGYRWDDIVSLRAACLKLKEPPPHAAANSVVDDCGNEWLLATQSDRGQRRSPRGRSGVKSPDWNAAWFLEGMQADALGPIDAVNLVIGWVRLHKDVKKKCLFMVQLRRSTDLVPEHGALLPVAPRVVSNSVSILAADAKHSISQIQSLNILADLLVALAVMLLQHHDHTVASDLQSLFVVTSNFISQALSPTAGDVRGFSFQDLNVISLHWSLLSQCAATHEKVAEGVHSLLAGIRRAVALKLGLIARHENLRPNTFVVAQLRMAAVFGCDPLECQKSVEAHFFTVADWEALLRNVPLHQIVSNATKEPRAFADTQPIVDLAVVLHRFFNDPLSQPPRGAVGDLVVAFSTIILPKTWSHLSAEEQLVIRAMCPNWQPTGAV